MDSYTAVGIVQWQNARLWLWMSWVRPPLPTPNFPWTSIICIRAPFLWLARGASKQIVESFSFKAFLLYSCFYRPGACQTTAPSALVSHGLGHYPTVSLN